MQTKRVTRTTRPAPPSEGCQLVFVGYDPSTGEYAALEIVDGSWHNSRFAPDRHKRSARKGKPKKAQARKELDRTSKPVAMAQRPSASSPPDASASSPPNAPAFPQTDAALIESVADLAPDLDMDANLSTPAKGPRTGGGKRGKITVFSHAQRRRLRERLWAVGPSLLPRRLPGGGIHYPASFVSLTYPGKSGWDDRFLDPHLCKKNLRAFWRRIERRHPAAWAIWVLELQGRGGKDLPPAWHFHLVVRWPDSLGETRQGWRDRNCWLSENWAQVVAGVPHPDPDHFGSGVGTRKVTNVDQLRNYLLKGGSKISLAQWQRYGAPFWPTEEQARLFQQRVEGVEHAVRKLAIDTNQGAWWRILGGPAYQRSCSVFACKVPPEVEVRVRASVAVSWREHFARRGKEVKYALPRWISGRHAVRALRKAGTTAQQLLQRAAPGDVVDVNTGEPIG